MKRKKAKGLMMELSRRWNVKEDNEMTTCKNEIGFGRRFSRNDWCGFAGATRFDSGNDPVIFNTTNGDHEYIVIGDAEGVEVSVFYTDAKDKDREYVFSQLLPSADEDAVIDRYADVCLMVDTACNKYIMTKLAKEMELIYAYASATHKR